MIQTVIFDMDGLLFDTERLTTRAWIEVGRRHGYPITMEFMNQMRGRKLADCARIFSEGFGEAFDYWKLREERIQYVEEFIRTQGVPVKKGAVEILRFLRENRIAAALATSTGRETAEDYLRKTGLLEFFDVLVTGDMVKRGKPDPEIFLKAADYAETPAEQCLVLEDSYSGIEAGYRAGCQVIMIPDTLPMTKQQETQICICCDSLLDVIPFLREENKIRNGA